MNGMQKPKRIGILCGGGDCPGLNAVIRAVVKTSILRFGWEVYGSEDSFDGFIQADRLIPMTLDTVRGILPLGGTILGTTNRGNPFRYPQQGEDGEIVYVDYSKDVMGRFQEMGLEALVVVGGDGTLAIAQRFFEAGLPVIGVPKTIDNDLLATEVTFGFDTALQTATDAIDRIHTTAASHGRVMFIELMGRNAGWIALEAGLAGGADVILIPEIPFHIESICRKLKERNKRGRRFSVVVVAEGAFPIQGERIYQKSGRDKEPLRLGGMAAQVADEVSKDCGVETRVIVLGHLQRGGSPTPFDRILGSRFGVAAVELAAREQFGRMVSLRCGQIDSVWIRDAVAHERLVDPEGERVRAVRSLGISFGD